LLFTFTVLEGGSTFTSVFKHKKSLKGQKPVEIKVFVTFIVDGRIRIRPDPDPDPYKLLRIQIWIREAQKFRIRNTEKKAVGNHCSVFLKTP
jgi:hypothetical protein